MNKTIGQATLEAHELLNAGDTRDEYLEYWEMVARAAVTCFLAKAKERGYELKPHTSTTQMYEAAETAFENGYVGEIWEAMYDAAPAIDLDAILKS